ncbi:putative Trafficking protein particle complex subunit 2-like protein [Hypsibius exemplaris]|uniref:Trafficking protein particle complex subunit 2-like protein n=1 Tax=Hypsibius exemplaris TaxID=2072580 RepID=A0A9X6NGH0_HYPEX|nr:putative Trafficking protein particle complex subunit 2-like protein [Hypsibius exemplaris]
MALCIGVMGAENQPLLIKISPNIQDPIKFHFMLHSALDVVEEKSQPLPKTPGSISGADLRELYLGLLYPSSDEVRVYGYCANTRMKMILIVEASNTTLRDNEIRTMFRRLHVAYSNMIMNPFYDVGQPISSKSFHDFVDSMIAAFGVGKLVNPTLYSVEMEYFEDVPTLTGIRLLLRS